MGLASRGDRAGAAGASCAMRVLLGARNDQSPDLEPARIEAAPQQLVNRAVTRSVRAHAAAIPACTNRRIEPIEIVANDPA